MKVLSIKGGSPLRGEAVNAGAKNSVLPLLAACVAVGGETTLHNCPQISDVEVARQILQALGCKSVWQGEDTLYVDARTLSSFCIPTELAVQMRASILFLGAVYARLGTVEIAAPGGCRLGERPIDLHLLALRALGAEITADERIACTRSGKAGGGYVHFRYPSVGATENALLAAMGCSDDTVLQGCAQEPEVTDLCGFLEACGATVLGAGSGTILVRGAPALHGAEYRVIPDRMEAVSLLCACAGSGGSIVLRDTQPGLYAAELEQLCAAGCTVQQKQKELVFHAPEFLSPIPLIATAPYPRFSTDALPPMMAALLRADGVSRFCETVFEDRFQSVAQMQKMGAQVMRFGRYARLIGGNPLHGCDLYADDLRGAAALSIAALQAEDESRIFGLEHLQRGYMNFPEKLCALGAQVRQIDV